MLRCLLFLGLFSFGTVCRGQDVKHGLIVVHVDPMSRGEFKQKIYSYHFVNGDYTGREELMVVSGKKEGKDYIRTDLGSNTLYKDRYLITGIGNILDLKEKKILFDGRAQLVRCSNDSAIYYTNDAFKGKYYSVYNFKTSQYGEVKNLLFKAKPGQDVEFDKSTVPMRIYLYPQNKPKVLLVSDAGYGQSGTAEGRVPDPAMWWLDNSSFVYANFNRDNSEISFFKVDADRKTSSLVGKAAIKPEKKAATLEKLDGKAAVMTLGTKQILIDAAANSVSDQVFSKPVNGFSYEIKTNSYGHIVKQNEKEIGKFHFQFKNFKTEKNIAAMVKEIIVGEDSYQQGIGVWNNGKQTWGRIDSEDVLTLAGFINE
jgi:hypothetical protein